MSTYKGFISLRPIDNVSIPCTICQTNNTIEIKYKQSKKEIIKISGKRYKKLYILRHDDIGICVLCRETLHHKDIHSIAGYLIKNSEAQFLRIILQERIK